MLEECKIADLAAAFVAEGREDWVGLWEIARAVELAGGEGADATRVESLRLIRALGKEADVRFGSPNRDGSFSAWDLPFDAALSRIDLEWRQLGRTLGDVVWLEINT